MLVLHSSQRQIESILDNLVETEKPGRQGERGGLFTLLGGHTVVRFQPRGHWLVSRTIYDGFGRAVISTDRFLVPIDTPLGEDPDDVPVPTQVTKTIYDDRGRSIATERYTGAALPPPPLREGRGEGPASCGRTASFLHAHPL